MKTAGRGPSEIGRLLGRERKTIGISVRNAPIAIVPTLALTVEPFNNGQRRLEISTM